MEILDLLANPLEPVDSDRLNYRSLVRSLRTRFEQSEPPDSILLRYNQILQQACHQLESAWLALLVPSLNERYAEFIAAPSNDAREPGEEALRQAFIQQLMNGGLLTLCKKKPVLARLLALRYRHWADALAEFFNRWEQDRQSLRQRFFSGNELEEIRVLETGLSDSHDGGRSVFILTFEAEAKLVYKPKSLAIDQHFTELVAELKANDFGIPLRALKAWDRGVYGWCEHVTDTPQAKLQPSVSIARALGQLLALGHALGCTDLHAENFALVEGQLVLWDLETFLRPNFELGQRSSRHHPSRKHILSAYEQSVIGVGLIDDSRKEDESLLTLTEETWPAYMEGFKSSYRWLQEHQEGLLGWLEKMRASVSFRMVFLPTERYVQQRQFSFHPHLLKDEAAWLQSLSQIRNTDPQNRLERWLHREEISALAQLDIPAFYHREDTLQEASGASMQLSKEHECYTTAIENARNKLQQLDENDLRFQLRLLQFHADGSRPQKQSSILAPQQSHPLIDTCELTQEGLRLADLIVEEAVVFESGAQWWGHTFSRQGKERLAPMLMNLYDGSIGPVLLLAAAYRICGKEDYRLRALQGLAPICHDFADDWRRKQVLPFMGPHGLNGIASLLYAGCLIANWVDDEATHACMAQIADLLDPSTLSTDKAYDIVGGSAGTILSLLRYEAQAPGNGGLQKAIHCGKHLLQHFPAPREAWQEGQTQPLGGFSHGAAGFAYALRKLAVCSQDSQFAEEADDWKAYQFSLQHSQTGQFRDLRMKSDQKNNWNGQAMCSWCHGAAGVLLGLSGELQWERAQASTRFESVLEAVRAHPIETWRDFLCCSNFGRWEILQTVAQDRKDAALESFAHLQMQSRLGSLKNGEFPWKAGSNRDHGGFHTGVSGIGYSLLRAGNPETLPCILRQD